MDILKPYSKDGGAWRFPASNDEYPCSTIDSLSQSRFLHEIYLKFEPNYEDKYSVPVCWDKETNHIVNNESEDIMGR